MYKLKVAPSAKKDFKKASRSGDKALLRKIAEIQQDPKRKGKLLQGDLAGFRSAKSPPWRIVYEVDDTAQTVEIIRIDTRDDAYEDIV